MIARVLWALVLVLIVFNVVRAEDAVSYVKVYDKLAQRIANLACPLPGEFAKSELEKALYAAFEENGQLRMEWLSMMAVRIIVYSESKAYLAIDRDNLILIPGPHEHFLVTNGERTRRYVIQSDIFEKKGFLMCD